MQDSRSEQLVGKRAAEALKMLMPEDREVVEAWVADEAKARAAMVGRRREIWSFTFDGAIWLLIVSAVIGGSILGHGCIVTDGMSCQNDLSQCQQSIKILGAQCGTHP